ncbi:MAG: molecular chaperone HtpG [Rickettsiales bacterium]|jgi:molecular chaperone HtpG|nr:molecular chaperone HtpG [Rickettsiales bacterium]
MQFYYKINNLFPTNPPLSWYSHYPADQLWWTAISGRVLAKGERSYYMIDSFMNTRDKNPMAEKQNFEFGVENRKILKLMIHSLYTNRDIAIRELISNSSDACDRLRYLSTTDPDILGDDTRLRIVLEVDEEARTVAIRDNGIGMGREDLIGQLGTIAKSGTESFLEQMSLGNGKNVVELIGQFGVGFYSSFMIAKRVEVISRVPRGEEAYLWESDGEGEFSIRKFDGEFTRGTQVLLHLKDDCDVFLDKFHLKHVVKSYSDHIVFPIELKMGTVDSSLETLNTGSALWTRPKTEIEREQYIEFYRQTVHLPGEPWMILHNRVEGNLEFTNLLFIPDRRNFDLFSPDMNTRVKLYIRRVFITEENIQLLPRYLRFVQGIVDSQDLPLNISRETLQYNSMVEKIRKALVKRIYAELEKRDQSEPEEYLKFWENFGAALKEGLCEHNVDNDGLLDLCKFYSSKSMDRPSGLKTYLERARSGQKTIYYLTGTSIQNLDRSPQVEGFKARGIEVLYLCDTVDDFWTTATHKYKDYQFKSIAKADIDVARLDAEEEPEASEADGDGDGDGKKDQGSKDAAEEGSREVLELFRSTLADCNLKDIRISKKLTTSPVCLVADERAMDIKLERFLLEQRQILAPMPKILEINIQHSLLGAIQESIGSPEKLPQCQEIIKTLFDEACILEGEPPRDPAAFAARLNEFMERGRGKSLERQSSNG